MNEAELKHRFPHASAAFLRANTSECEARAGRLPSAKPEPYSGKALDGILQGKEAGGPVSASRTFILFHIHCTHPRDWDNTFTKPLQDLLVEIGLLAGDDWTLLQGAVIPHKVKTKKAQRTEIEIWYDQSSKGRAVFPLPPSR